MFKARAESGPSKETVRKEGRGAAKNLRQAQANAAKKGKKLSDAQVVRTFLTKNSSMKLMFNFRGQSGYVVGRGVTSKKNQAAFRKGRKKDEAAIARQAQRNYNKESGNAKALLKELGAKEGKTFLASYNRITGGLGKIAVRALQQRAKGKSTAKVGRRPTGGKGGKGKK